MTWWLRSKPVLVHLADADFWWHILNPPELGAALRQAQWSRCPPSTLQHRPEHKHSSGLVEERETPFIYGHV